MVGVSLLDKLIRGEELTRIGEKGTLLERSNEENY